jgi:hypothetical protein
MSDKTPEFRIAVLDEQGKIVDTYDGVRSSDIGFGEYSIAINKWLRRTLEKAEEASNAE